LVKAPQVARQSTVWWQTDQLCPGQPVLSCGRLFAATSLLARDFEGSEDATAASGPRINSGVTITVTLCPVSQEGNAASRAFAAFVRAATMHSSLRGRRRMMPIDGGAIRKTDDLHSGSATAGTTW
jgi:hypothetical protein